MARPASYGCTGGNDAIRTGEMEGTIGTSRTGRGIVAVATGNRWPGAGYSHRLRESL